MIPPRRCFRRFLFRTGGRTALTAAMPPLRPALTALLFTPGNQPERFARAAASGADGIIIDWEDAVPEPEKDRVRAEVLSILERGGGVGVPPFATSIRINALRTGHGRADLDALRSSPFRPDLVVLPKVESAAEVLAAAERLAEGVALLALIETVLGVRHVVEIAAASPRLVALAFGGFDLSAETGGEPVWEALLAPRTQVVHACAAAGLLALDQPWLELADLAGLGEECARARALGFTGKLAIHPRQCAVIRAAFQPPAADLARARRIVAACAAAGGRVVTVDGRMIDPPLATAARRLLRRAGE